MISLLFRSIALVVIAAAAAAGVKVDDVFKTLDGGTVTLVDHKTTTFGDIKYRARETQSDGDVLDSGQSVGTPTLGGCAGEVEDGPEQTTSSGDDPGDGPAEKGGTFKVEGGKMKQKGSDGKWHTLKKTKEKKGKEPDPQKSSGC